MEIAFIEIQQIRDRLEEEGFVCRMEIDHERIHLLWGKTAEGGWRNDPRHGHIVWHKRTGEKLYERDYGDTAGTHLKQGISRVPRRLRET